MDEPLKEGEENGEPARKSGKIFEHAKENEEFKNVQRTKQRSLDKQSVILLTILAVLFIGFLAGYNLLKQKPYFNYEGFKVYPTPLSGTSKVYYSIPITFEIGSTTFNETLVIKTDPRLLENITVNVSDGYFSSRAEIIMLFEPKAPSRIIESMFEITKVARILGIPLGIAVTHETESSEDKNFSVMSCNESSAGKRIIFFNGSASENKVYEDKCIKIESPDYEQLDYATDAFVWKWLLLIRKQE